MTMTEITDNMRMASTLLKGVDDPLIGKSAQLLFVRKAAEAIQECIPALENYQDDPNAEALLTVCKRVKSEIEFMLLTMDIPGGWE
jgi:hypothetical protein